MINVDRPPAHASWSSPRSQGRALMRSHSFFRTLSGAHCPQNKARLLHLALTFPSSLTSHCTNHGPRAPAPLTASTSLYMPRCFYFLVFAFIVIFPWSNCHHFLKTSLSFKDWFKVITLLSLQGASFLLHCILNMPLI